MCVHFLRCELAQAVKSLLRSLFLSHSSTLSPSFCLSFMQGKIQSGISCTFAADKDNYGLFA